MTLFYKYSVNCLFGFLLNLSPKRILSFTIASVLFCSSIGNAETFNDHAVFDNYEVHYSVFNSTFVPADVAANYGVKRSAYESLINVSVSPRGKYGALPATLSGTITNLLQQQKPLEFIEIAEKNATYYIAPLRIAGEETVHFALKVTPKGSDELLEIKFSRKLYSDK